MSSRFSEFLSLQGPKFKREKKKKNKKQNLRLKSFLKELGCMPMYYNFVLSVLGVGN